ncbi:MAG: hypothetical protein J0H39_13815 [Alphaproteobacteria bacterium]|nr:hypothetical protein [Alphaproteobacteria bacterium]
MSNLLHRLESVIVHRAGRETDFLADCAAINEAVELLIECERVFGDLLTFDRVERPAFRSKPLGAPNSTVRIAQDKLIALEDAASATLAKLR